MQKQKYNNNNNTKTDTHTYTKYFFFQTFFGYTSESHWHFILNMEKFA